MHLHHCVLRSILLSIASYSLLALQDTDAHPSCLTSQPLCSCPDHLQTWPALLLCFRTLTLRLNSTRERCLLKLQVLADSDERRDSSFDRELVSIWNDIYLQVRLPGVWVWTIGSVLQTPQLLHRWTIYILCTFIFCNVEFLLSGFFALLQRLSFLGVLDVLL